MVWHLPTVLVGEFDSIHGPMFSYASQFFYYAAQGAAGSQVAACSLLTGEVAVGKSAVTGSVRETFQELLRPIAVRALATSDTHDDGIIWTDPKIGGLTSLTFLVGDILARGENRKFCIVTTHPDHDTAVSKWPLIAALSNVLSLSWRAQAQQRVANEYTQVADLPRRREEARQRQLRSLLTLLSSDTQTEADVLMDLHCTLECLFPKIFPRWGESSALLDVNFTVMLESARIGQDCPLTERLRKHVNRYECAVRAASAWHTPSRFANPTVSVVEGASTAEIHNGVAAVKPLAAWLRALFASEHSVASAFSIKAGKILKALLSGNQIMISASHEDVAANLGLALAQVLPRKLRLTVLRSDTYRESYACRLLTFSDAFIDRVEIVHHRDLSTKDQLVLSELHATGALHLFVHDNERTVSVDDCDAVIATTSDTFVDARPLGLSPTALPTVVQKIILRVVESCQRLSEAPDGVTVGDVTELKHEVTTLQLKIEALVQEYVSRGRLYVRQFQVQEIERNAQVLGVQAGEAPTPTQSLVGRLLRTRPAEKVAQTVRHSATLAGDSAAAASISGTTSVDLRSSTTLYARDAPYATTEKRSSTLSVSRSSRAVEDPAVNGDAPTTSHFVRSLPTSDLTDSTPADHEVLTFLGSAR